MGVQRPRGTRAESLPRRERLRKRADFLATQTRGARVSGRHYLLVVLRDGRTPAARFGVTVSKKVGTAVIRNRVKRWLREAYRRRDRSRGPATGDLVVIARPSAADAGYAATATELGRLLDRAGTS